MGAAWVLLSVLALSSAACAERAPESDGGAGPTLTSTAPALVAGPIVDERTIADPRIDEASGMAAGSPDDVVWIVNDSGGGPVLFAVDADGRTAGTARVNGVPARDWEALALDTSDGRRDLVIGDIGDNRGTWPTVRVHRVREPADPRGVRRLKASTTTLRFADGPRDAEGLMVSPLTGRLYVVDKQLTGAAIHVAPDDWREGGTVVLTRWRKAPPLVTDAAFSPDGRRYALRTYATVRIYDAATGAEILEQEVPLQVQSETLTWTRDGAALLLGSEGRNQTLLRLPLT